jgi:hypothetical protein
MHQDIFIGHVGTCSRSCIYMNVVFYTLRTLRQMGLNWVHSFRSSNHKVIHAKLLQSKHNHDSFEICDLPIHTNEDHDIFSLQILAIQKVGHIHHIFCLEHKWWVCWVCLEHKRWVCWVLPSYQSRFQMFILRDHKRLAWNFARGERCFNIP